MKRRGILRILSITALASMNQMPRAQSYPTKPITLLVGGAPGSVPDLMIRPIAERLSASLGHAVVVDNKPGAAGSIAMAALGRSAPDGHTLGLVTMSQAVFNTYLFAKLPYDALRDLEPVAPLVTGAMVLAAHPTLAARSFPEFISLAKSQPGKLFVAIPQLGSPPHVVGLLLSRAAGIEVKFVPHTSGATAVTAVLAGDIPLLLDAPTIISPHVVAGKLKALAVTGRQREALLPQTPTAIESGIDAPGEAWLGLVVPAGTPSAVVQRLNREITTLMGEPEISTAMAKLGFRALTSSPDAFRGLIQQEHAKWGGVIRDAGLKLE